MSTSEHNNEPQSSHTFSGCQIWAHTTDLLDLNAYFAKVIGADGKVLKKGTNGLRSEAFMPMPEDGFKDPHMALPACSDANAVDWANDYKAGTIPNMEGNGGMWMIHGDLEVDNFVIGTDDQKDASSKHFIESGPNIILLPRDLSSLEGYPQTTQQVLPLSCLSYLLALI